MPPTAVEIFVPCELFDVAVQLGPRGGISTLELLVLRALKEGVEYFDDLASLFQIGYRPMLNLIADLWRQNHVTIDFGAARLEVAPEVAAKLGTAAESSLRGGARTQRVVTLMQELVCGHLLLAAAPPLHTHANRIAPQLKPYGSFLNVAGAAVRQAIESFVASWSADTRPLAVLSANLPVNDLAAPRVGQRRLLAVEVQCTTGDTGRLELRIVQPLGKLDGVARRDLERMLALLVEERPDDQFSRFLREQPVARRKPAPASVRQQVRALASRIPGVDAGVAAIDMAAAQTLHDDLAQQAQAVLESLVQRHARRSKLRLLTGGPAITGAVRSALGEAVHQVVLASPSARSGPVNATAVSLKKLLQKPQRQAFVLWGQRPEDRLESAVTSAFVDLETAGRFFWPRHSARSSMSFLLRDDDRCIFSNSPLLDDAGGITLGVQVDPFERSGPNPTAREQLERVARIFPDFNMAAKLVTAMAARIEAAPPSPPDLPRIPTGPLDSLRHAAGTGTDFAAPGISGALLANWRAGWSSFVAALVEAQETLDDSVELVHDGRHREALLDALMSSPSLVIVGSAELSSRGLDTTLRQAIADAARGGARIVLLYSRGRGHDEAMLARLRELVDGSAGRIVALPCDWQGGLLLVDDALLLTSFQLLAKAGRFDDGSPLPMQHDTGILVRSAELAAAACAYLEAHLPHGTRLRLEPASAPKDRPPLPVAALPAAASEHLQILLARLACTAPEADGRSPRLRGESIRQWLGEAREAGVPVDSLLSLIPSLDRRDQGMVMATCLQLEPPGSETRAVLLRRLCVDCWQTGAFHEATILRSRLNKEDAAAELPPVWLSRMAAVRHDPQQLGALLLTPALLKPLTQEEAASLTCIGCSALALGGMPAAFAVLDAQRESVPQVLATWVEEIMSYWADTGLAVPRSILHGSHSATPAVREREAHTALRTAFDAAASMSFNFVLGKKTWRRLFHEQGELGRLGAAIHDGNSAVVRDWLAKARRLDRGADTLLDDAARETAERDPQLLDERIIGSKRVSCLQRLDELLRCMVEWVELQDALTDEPQARLLARGRRLASTLAATRDDLAALEQAAAQRSELSLPLLRMLRADFAALLEG
jgi:hypothetical protein